MKSPRSLADLPFAAALRPFAGVLELDEDYDRVLFNDSAFADAAAGGSRFAESAFTGVTFDGGRARRARLSQVWVSESRFVAFDLAESALVDVWFSGCVLAGVQAFALTARRLTFRDCKLDSVNFRDSSLTDVLFDGCVLRDADFGGARLTRVRFPGCTLRGADFTKASCTDVDLRGAALGGAAGEAGIRAGFDALGGARIDALQLITLAPFLARHLGIIVEDA
ncbi:pentapeptide repeat-containing protein [Trebonia sp.]|uniref:pentapeptide repeat-containing protein n=1 Tax=Trebonia sp. TaxID=2767075 RepID=UPI0026052991|nr:pentapeptide repeat-containing protein [Trebonia sp.]